MVEVNLIEFEGFQITVASWNGTFRAYKKDNLQKELYSAESLDALKEKIKRHNSDARHFKPLKVIQIGSDTVGRITSRVADSEREVFFTVKENPKARASRRQTPLLNYGWGEDKDKPLFAKATPENLVVLEKIQDLESQIKTLRDLQTSLRGTYGDLITFETLGGQE